MPDTNNPFSGLGSFFFANDPQGASAQAMRQKIALAMMMKKAAAPKTFGEGLYSVGDSLSDALIGRNSVAVAAQSAAEADRQIEDVRRGTTPGKISETAIPDAGQTASATPPGGNAPGWNTFAQEYSPGGLGLSQPQAAGLVGNLQAESTPAIKPSGVVGDAGTAFGAAQWRGPRLEALKQYAASQGVSPWTTEAQQGFMRHELMGTGNQPGREAGAYAALTQARTPREAAAVVDERYERSSGEHRGQRVANAENIYRSLPNPRGDVTATLVARQQQPPAGPAGPQDALLGEVTGMAGPASAASFAPTASLNGRVGDVTSDMPSVTGAVGGPAGAGVVDTLQQRNDAMRPPQAAAAPPGPQTAQAGPFPAPTMDASGRVAPIMPGGGFPQTPIPVAPPDTRAAIQKMPAAEEYVPRDRPMPQPPAKPQGIGPEERRLQRQLYGDVDPRVKAAAEAIVTRERSDRNAQYESELKAYEPLKAEWLKERELETQYKMKRAETSLDIEEKRRKLAGEQINELTPQERAIIGPDLPGVKTYKDQFGRLQKIVGPQSVSVDMRGEAEESKVRGKLNAEREDITLKAADQAGASLGTLARAEALHNRIITGALEPGRTTVAALGRSMGIPDETLKTIGLRPEEIGSRQAFNAIVNELVVSKLGPGGFPTNNFSEGDRKFLINTAPGLGDDDESNRIKIASARLVSERNIEKADRWGDYREANPGKSYADFERAWNKEVRERNDTGELQKRAEALLEGAKKSATDQAPTRIDPKEKADAIKWIGDNPNSPKIPAIKQRYGLP